MDNNGKLNVEWIHECDETRSPTPAPTAEDFSEEIAEIQDAVNLSTFIFFAIVVALGAIAIYYSCYRVMKLYPASDPVNFLAVGWLVLELWDFFSDVAFTIYLYFLYELEGKIYFFFGVIFLGVPYIGNLYYLVHLLQIWNHPKAPGQTRHWLELWSWYVNYLII